MRFQLNTKIPVLFMAWVWFSASALMAETESFVPFKNETVPQTFEELWAGFDPQKEPLDVEILKEWEEDGVVLKVLRYRIGVFKGRKAMMAAIYGFPKGGRRLPGLVQIHGGGQYANYKAPLTNAKRGYATISISWAGRIDAPDYKVTPEIVRLFWDDKTEDSRYKLTTDWGNVDGYHAPCRFPESNFIYNLPSEHTLDPVESPRNSGWFLCTVGARRALTFLEQQPEVDPDKLGVYGHSMGGKLTVLTTAADSRVKASAPSCGGLSDRCTEKAYFNTTLADDVSLKHISCPILFLSPSNDFHGRIDDLQTAIHEIVGKDWRLTCSPHHNHQDTAAYEVASQLWFDQYLKGTFTFPKAPQGSLILNTDSHIPVFTVQPDTSRPILSVDIFYTQQGQMDGQKNDRENTINRFWHHVQAVKKADAWTAELPLFSTDKPLWVYANVLYPLEKPITGAGYYYGVYTAETFNLSSEMAIVTPEELKAATVKATLIPSLMIETFGGEWEKEWFTYKPEDWARRTHKLYDDQWKASVDAKLGLEICAAKPNKMVIGIDTYGVEVDLKGNFEWQSVVLSAGDFHDATGRSLSDWSGIKELRLSSTETLSEEARGNGRTVILGAEWQGSPPEFRNMRWVKDDESDKQEVVLKPDLMWTYKKVGEKHLQMSVFLPENYDSADTFPAMVIFHGGSWKTGEPDWHYPGCACWSQ